MTSGISSAALASLEPMEPHPMIVIRMSAMTECAVLIIYGRRLRFPQFFCGIRRNLPSNLSISEAVGANVKRYQVMEHTADLMVRAYGCTLEECFANAGYALFDQTVDLSTAEPLQEMEIRVSESHIEDRLYAFLSELLFIEDCDNMVLCELEVRFEGDEVICWAAGEPLDRGKHRLKSEIKAVTYHMMEVDPETPSVTVIFDV